MILCGFSDILIVVQFAYLFPAFTSLPLPKELPFSIIHTHAQIKIIKIGQEFEI